jgi:methoxymalonate biosynthesis acyl carrier protein
MIEMADGRVEQAGQSAAKIEQGVLRFLEAQTRRTWDAQTDLFAPGELSSLFALQLVVFLEENHGISIRGKDLRLDNFRTVRNMIALVERLRGE